MAQTARSRKPALPPGIPTVGDILDKSDEDRAARMFAEANANLPDPFVAIERDVSDAYDEAKGWLDGTKVENQQQADALGKLHTMLDDAAKAAEAQRVLEKKPHDDAAAAVQKRYKPLVDKATLAAKTVKRAVERWNEHQKELLRVEAERVRKEAEAAAAKAAEEARAAREANDLSAIEAAEQQLANAATLDDMAKRAEKAKAITATAGARGIGTVPMRWIGRLDESDPLATDTAEARRKSEHALMAHYWTTKREWLVGVLIEEATRDIRSGSRIIPGLVIAQEKAQ